MKSLPSKDAKLKLRRTRTERVAWNSRKVKISEGWRRRGHMGTCSRISFRRIVWGQRCFGPEPSDGVCKLAELSRSTAASTYRYTRGTPFEYGFCNQFTTMRAILESRFFLRFEHKRQTESLPGVRMPVDSRTVIFVLLYERWERKWYCLSAMSFLFSLLTYYGRCKVDRKLVNWKLATLTIYICKFMEMQT